MKKYIKIFIVFLVVGGMSCSQAIDVLVEATPIPLDYCNIECIEVTDFEIYRPNRKVKLDAFLICDHEVTQGEWQWVMGNVNDFVTSDKGGKGTNYPMNNISWYDAVRFCNALSKKHGFEKCYTINGDEVTCDFNKQGYRLPTVAEWEYASCAGKSGELPYSGAETPDNNDIESYVWYGSNSGGTSHEVRTKKANAFGIYDMSGNVWEWCWDWYGKDYTETDYPKGPATGTEKGLRGGGYKCDPSYVRARSYGVFPPEYQWALLGLRVCRSAP